MSRENEAIQGVIDELNAVRHGEGKAWIYNEEGGVRDDVCVIDAVKVLEAMKDRDEIFVPRISDEQIADIKAEATEALDVLRSLKTAGDVIAFINAESQHLFVDLDSIELSTDEGVVTLDYVDIDSVDPSTPVYKIGLDEYGEYIKNPVYCSENGENEFFNFNIDYDDYYGEKQSLYLEETDLDSFEQTLRSMYDLDVDDIYARTDSDKHYNTYNWSGKISNDIDWCECGTEEYGKIAMVKFHIAGDVRGNYTDELFIKLDDFDGSLVSYLYDGLDVGNANKTVEVDGKEYAVDYNIFGDTLEISDTENWDNVTDRCCELEVEDIKSAIREAVSPMQSIEKADVKDENTKTVNKQVGKTD